MELHWGTSFEPLSQHHCFSSSSNPSKLLRWRQACNSHVACASRCKVSEQSPASTTFVSHTSRLNRAGPSTQLYISRHPLILPRIAASMAAALTIWVIAVAGIDLTLVG